MVWTARVVLTESRIELHRFPSPGSEAPPMPVGSAPPFAAALDGECGGARGEATPLRALREPEGVAGDDMVARKIAPPRYKPCRTAYVGRASDVGSLSRAAPSMRSGLSAY